MEDLIGLLVEELYGSDPSKVAKTLYLKNKSTFRDLMQYIQINEQALRNALTILIQQLIISYEEKFNF